MDLWGTEMWAVLSQAGPGKPRHCPVIMKTIIQLYVPRTLELDPRQRLGQRRGIPNSQFENWCSEILAFIPQSAINNGLTLRHSMVESALCIFISDKWSWYFSCHTLEGISKMQDKAALLLLMLSMDKSRRTIYSWKFMVDGYRVVYNISMS